MANSTSFKNAFDELAVNGNGYIGDPNGEPAYVYIRVSTEEQAVEGRSGLSRQIGNIHEIALKEGFKASWDMVFADDYTGFKYEDRPALTRLRAEYQTKNRRASVILMEHLDRLSRNADWHQGFLLNEMEQHHITPVFWKKFGSRMERMVQGAVSQDGMELALARMQEGTRAKARSGRVTSRNRAFGYKFVDKEGNEGSKSRKDTYYALYEPEAQVVRRIYEEVASGKSLRAIARNLTHVFPTPKGKVQWGKSTITALVRSPNYKGEFHAFRWSKDSNGHNIELENYIVVSIPAVVSEELWDAANEMLAKNRQMAQRRAIEPYLLSGLIVCSTCGRTYVGHSDRTRYGRNGQEVRKSPQRTYGCNSRSDHRKKELLCRAGKIGCNKLDNAVWGAVCSVLLDPSLLIGALETQHNNSGYGDVVQQIDFLMKEVGDQRGIDEKLVEAYKEGAFTAKELKEQRKFHKEAVEKLLLEIERLRSKIFTPEDLQQRKQFLLQITEQFRQVGTVEGLPFDLKQQIIKLVVNKIVLDTNAGWFQIEGAISGTYSLENVISYSLSGEQTNQVEGIMPSTSYSQREKLPFATKNTRFPVPHSVSHAESAAYNKPSLHSQVVC